MAWDMYAGVRYRVQRHAAIGSIRGLAVDRIRGPDEEHRVVHRAERHRDPAGHVGRGAEMGDQGDDARFPAATRQVRSLAAAKRDFRPLCRAAVWESCWTGMTNDDQN